MAGKKKQPALTLEPVAQERPDEEKTTSELIDMVVDLREQVRGLQQGSEFAFRMLRDIGVMLGVGDASEDSVNVDALKRRIIELQHLQRCGRTEEMPRIFGGDPGETELVGPCIKVRDHIERGDPWHKADEGMEWMRKSSLLARDMSGQEATFNGA